MADADLIALFVRPLEALQVPYMITGGVAAVIYGDPRFTRDIDLVLELRPSGIDRFVSAFSPDDFYVPPVEALEREVGRPRGGHFNLIHRDTALRADVYLAGEDVLHTWAFGRRVRLGVDDVAIWVAPVEYVIVRKLEYFRASGSDRHARDVGMILRISGDSIDAGELHRWVERRDLGDALEAARAHDR